MKTRKSIFLRAVLLPSAILIPLLSAHAQEKEIRKFSLKEAREYAIQNSFETMRSELDLASAHQKVKETTATGLPQIGSAVSYNNNLKLPTSLIPNFFEGKPEEKIPVQFGTQHNASANIQVQQLIFNGSYIVGLQASRIFQSLTEQELDKSQLDVQENVTNSYCLILIAEESERILQSNLSTIQKTGYEVQELYKEGFVPETDADLIQITVNQLRNGLQRVQKQKEMAFKLLKFQMGLELEEEIVLTDTLEQIFNPADVQRSLQADFDLEESIDYQVVQSQARMAEMNLKNEKAQYWPTVSAFFTYQQNAFRSSFNFLSSGQRWFPVMVLGFNISFPIFRSGVQSARVQQAEIALEQAQEAVLQAARGLQLEVEQIRTDLSLARENYLTTKANMDLSGKVYEATLEKYREGIASSLDLNQSNNSYLQAQASYIQAISELLDAKNKLDRLTARYPQL